MIVIIFLNLKNIKHCLMAYHSKVMFYNILNPMIRNVKDFCAIPAIIMGILYRFIQEKIDKIQKKVYNKIGRWFFERIIYSYPVLYQEMYIL